MKEPQHNRRILWILAGVLLAVIAVSFLMGRYPVPPLTALRIVLDRILRGLGGMLSPIFPSADGWGLEKTWESTLEAVTWNIRLPRILLACMVGCCLSSAGGAYQGVFQNPMASPDLLGASNGAAFGAALAILLGLGSRMVTLLAFAFSILTVFLAFLVSKIASGRRVLTLVLAGIMIGSLFSAGTSFLKLIADPTSQLPEITYWLMGSLSSASWSDVGLAILPMLVGLIPLLLVRWKLNLLTLGDEEARTMGVNASRIRLIVILSATLITAASVAVSGMIGWVGLVIPHLSRKLTGNDYKYLMPATMLFGAAFMLLVDDAGRTLFTAEVPLGILTALIGAPFFIWLITRKEDAY